MRIAVVANGEMGSAVAGRLRSRGAEVFTSLSGRSAASQERAHRAGLQIVDDDNILIESVDIFLSIVPPGCALSLAQRFAAPLARHEREFLYVDCNAVSPETVHTIAGAVNVRGVLFVDAGIIGGPPRGEAKGPRFYASGANASRFGELEKFGLDVRVIDGGVGAASALKLSYAALTKGITALGVLAARGATTHGVAESLRREFTTSQPELAAWLAHRIPRMYPKAYRFVGEMEEIACFLGPGGGAETFTGIARTYDGVAATFAGKDAATLQPLAEVFQTAREADVGYRESGSH